MTTLLLPPNSCCSLPSIPIPLQLRNPKLTSLKFNTNQRHTSKTLSYCPLIVRAFDNDSNPQTVQGGEVNNLGVKAALTMLRFYKREISPILPKSCRYIPTCSEYSMEAYKRYGVVKGTVLTAWRLCRCNPFGGYGYDPPRWFDEIGPREEVDD